MKRRRPPRPRRTLVAAGVHPATPDEAVRAMLARVATLAARGVAVPEALR